MKEEKSKLYYFYSVGCVYCNKVEPIVDKLNSNGYDIVKLDTTHKANELFKKEVEEKFKIKCGTPLLVDSETGNNICGLRDEDTIKKWADGEKITEPPKPKSPPPPLPQDLDNEEQVKTWKSAYKKWAKENSHLPNLTDSSAILERLKKQVEIRKQQESPENRIKIIEQKLDRLMNHLGVK